MKDLRARFREEPGLGLFALGAWLFLVGVLVATGLH